MDIWHAHAYIYYSTELHMGHLPAHTHVHGVMGCKQVGVQDTACDTCTFIQIHTVADRMHTRACTCKPMNMVINQMASPMLAYHSIVTAHATLCAPCALLGHMQTWFAHASIIAHKEDPLSQSYPCLYSLSHLSHATPPSSPPPRRCTWWVTLCSCQPRSSVGGRWSRAMTSASSRDCR